MVDTRHIRHDQMVAGVGLLQVLTQGMGYILSDVMCDAMVVERSKYEPPHRVGHMQAVAYTVRYIGAILGSVAGMMLYSPERWGWSLDMWQVLAVNGLIGVLLVGPTMWSLEDQDMTTNNRHHRPLRAQLKGLWEMGSLPSVYLPMTFLAVFNLLMGFTNPAWKNFLFKALDFNNFQNSIIGIIATIFGWLGILAYRVFFYRTSWRMVYIVTTLLIMAFSVLQLCLIFRVNRLLGISDLVFAVGDDALMEFVWAVQFLPAVKMYLKMCPDGSEGTVS